ncbi:MAG: hypothetical protein ACD_67C00230G0001, partial [uncultured bacterium]
MLLKNERRRSNSRSYLKFNLKGEATMNQKNALLSVYNKTGIVPFASSLVELGYTIYSSGGTAEVIAAA